MVPHSLADLLPQLRLTFSLVLVLLSLSPRGLAAADPPLATERIVAGLARPVGLTHRSGDASRLYVIEQHSGDIRVIRDGILLPDPFLSIGGLSTGSEQGLLGLAFHPDSADDRFFVYFTRGDRAGVLRSYRISPDPDLAVTGSGEDLLVIPQPQSNHNGGWLAFGPTDDLLYLGLGDGGGGGDDDGGHGSRGNGQATANLLGTILRLDIDVPPDEPGDPPYLIPPGNPTLVGVDNNGDSAPPRPEILHFGLRNPWRCGFDPLSGDLYIGDVGQGSWEEISFAAGGTVGVNFGWRKYEGDHIFKNGDPIPDPPAIAPIHEYDRGDGKAVIGGSIYRGAALPALHGAYFFGDYTSSRIWSLRYDGNSVSDLIDRTAELAPASGSIDDLASFGTDADGELYICDRDGEIYRIISAVSGEQPPSITSTPLTMAVAGLPYASDVDATGDPTPTFTLDTAPAGLTIDSATGQIAWTPAASGEAPVTVRASNGIAPDATLSFTISVSSLRPADNPTSALAGGLHASHYAGSWTALPDFASLTASGSSLVDQPVVPDTDHVAYRFTGFIDIPADGLVTLSTISDEGSQLFIGDTLVVDNDGTHGAEERSGSIGLAAGQHQVTVTFFEVDGDQSLEVRWDGPGITGPETVPVTAWLRYADPYGRDDPVASPAFLAMPATIDGALPALLSQTGVFQDLTSLRPVAGILPYGVNSPLWSDGAAKTRWIAVPAGETIDFDPTGNWAFPAGTVLIKHFELGTEAHRVETRLLMVNGLDTYGVTYRWRDDGSEADLITAGATADLTVDGGSQTWRFPSSQQCLECHTPQTGRVLGVRTRQLNGEQRYPTTDRSDNQLRTWNHQGLFSTTLDEDDIPSWDSLVAIDDGSASLTHRVRSYIDANCMMCHQPGASQALFDARYATPLAEQGIIDGAVNDDLGIAGARVVVPGDVARSLLHHRLQSQDPAVRMPPLARLQVDQQAVSVLASWIAGLDTPPTITTPPAANPDPVVGVSTTLSVGADDDGDLSALIYTWTTTAAPAGASDPVISPNASNDAATATVSFSAAGSYSFSVAVADDTHTTTDTLTVQVLQTPSGLSLQP